VALEGVDYAFPPRPRPSELVRLGKKFAVRYGGPGTANKWITAAEARELTAAGIVIVANAEGSASGLLGGWSVGVSWATSAEAYFRSIGMPPNRPIYLSVDFEVTSSQWSTVASALRGAASVIGLPRLGVYGGRNAIRWAQRDGAAKWFWQTYAWSYGTWEPNTHMQQYRNGVQIDGADCDLNRALTADFGQWQVGGGTNDMIPIAFGEGEKPAPPSSRVQAMQLAGVRAGYDLTPFGGADGRYGNGTAGMLVALLGEIAGDGHLYDAPQYDALQAKAYGGGTVPVPPSAWEAHIVLPGATINVPPVDITVPVIPAGK
jgi:hypothetical protein